MSSIPDSSILTLLPDIEIGPVTYCPRPVADDPTYPPKVRVEFAGLGSGLSLSIADARRMFAGLGDALTAHDRFITDYVQAVA